MLAKFNIGDRVKYVGPTHDSVQLGESGIIRGVFNSFYTVQFSSEDWQCCFAKEIVLLNDSADLEAKLVSAPQPIEAPYGDDLYKKVAEEIYDKPKGAVKNDSGKPDMSLIPEAAMEAFAEAMMVGELKYGSYNYLEGGFTSRRLAAAAIRHLMRYLRGEDRCPKDGQLHLGAALANCGIILHLKQEGVLVDDRYRSKTLEGPKQASGGT